MEKKKIVTVGLIQTSVSEDVALNLHRALRLAAEAAERGAQIICLPELFRTRYFPQDEKIDASHLAETIPGESTDAFSKFAREHQTVVIVPLYEKANDGRLYNSAVVIDADGKLFPTYRKIHIPQDRYFYEQNYFAPGNQGFLVHQTRYAAISVMICFDQWYPEGARIAALQGAEIVFYPTAIGSIKNYAPEEGDWQAAWETVQRGHAIANNLPVCAVNRAGEEKELQFWGGSFLYDSFGSLLAKAGAGEEVLVAKIDLGQNEFVREGWGFFRNRRPDAYQKICDAKK